jgi:hypothetical protein
MEDTEGRRYMEYASMWVPLSIHLTLSMDRYGSYKILVWFAKKYPELYINDETKETILHFAASQGLTEVGSRVTGGSMISSPGNRVSAQDQVI